MEIETNCAEFLVLVNSEEQYSIWPAHSPIPAGWHEVGQRGSNEACVAYVSRVWTDMRPKSLRDTLEEP